MHHALSYAGDAADRTTATTARTDGGAVPRRVRVGQERRGLSGGLGRAAEGGQQGAASAITCTRSAKRSTRRSSSGSCSIRRATCRSTSAGRRQLAQPTDAARHPGGHGRAQRRLHDPPQAGADHRVPAAHAHPRQASVPRADLPDVGHAHDDRDDQLRELQLQLAPRLQLRRRRAAARAGRHDPPHHPVARQHDGEPARNPIRRTGSATASARSTRWASSGSAGSS